MRRCLQLTPIFLLLLVSLPAGSAPRILPRWLASRPYTHRDGLPSMQINALWQDPSGRIWIGTGDGLTIYDGHLFHVIGKSDGLPHTYVTCIVPDPRQSGVVWIGTLGGGLCRWANGAVREIPAGSDARSNEIVAITADRRGRIWCTTNAGLCVLDGDSLRAVHSLNAKTPPTDIISVGQRGLWVLRADGIDEVDPDTRHVKRTNPGRLTGGEEYSQMVSGDGCVWMTTSRNRLLRIVGDSLQGSIRFRFKIAPVLVDSLDRQFWLVSPEGLLRIDEDAPLGERIDTVIVGQRLGFGSLTAGLVDREQNLWLGSFAFGLLRVENLQLFTAPVDVPDYSVNNAGAVTMHDRLLVASGGSLLEYWQDPSRRWRCAPHFSLLPPDVRIHGVVTDGGNTLWTIYDNGLLRRAIIAQTGTDRPSEIRWKDEFDLRRIRAGWTVMAAVPDSEGNLWVSVESAENGMPVPALLLLSWREGVKILRTVEARDGLPNASLRTLVCDAQGRLWIGSYDAGLGILAIGQGGTPALRWLTVKDGLTDNAVRTLRVLRNGAMLVGTRYGGILAISGDTIHSWRQDDGLLCNAVWGIAETGRDTFWLGTSIGMQMLDAKAWRFRRDESMTGDRVLSCGSIAGKALWWISAGKLSVYSLGDGRLVTIPPSISITRWSAAGRSQPLAGGVELEHTENDCVFGYAGVTFRDEGEMRYRYRMLGHDTAWEEPTTERSVTYAALPPGQYVFQVVALSVDGSPSPAAAEVRFAILRPLWLRWWMVLLELGLSLAVLYALYRYRLARLLEIERLRSRIAGDLHDDVGTNLSSIFVASELMRRKFDLAPEQDRVMAEIGGTASRTQELMRDIVWMLNPQNDSMDNLLVKMRDLAVKLIGDREVRFTVEGALPTKRLSMDFKRHILLLYKEAIHNIVRHSGATAVEIRVEFRDTRLSLRISDNGRGFQPAADGAGHGLPGMRQRAAGIGGELDIFSAPGKGSTVELIVNIT